MLTRCDCRCSSDFAAAIDPVSERAIREKSNESMKRNSHEEHYG